MKVKNLEAIILIILAFTGGIATVGLYKSMDGTYNSYINKIEAKDCSELFIDILTDKWTWTAYNSIARNEFTDRCNDEKIVWIQTSKTVWIPLKDYTYTKSPYNVDNFDCVTKRAFMQYYEEYGIEGLGWDIGYKILMDEAYSYYGINSKGFSEQSDCFTDYLFKVLDDHRDGE